MNKNTGSKCNKFNDGLIQSFPEVISPFIKKRLQELRVKYGENSSKYKGLARQYIISPKEKIIHEEERDRHYEADSGYEWKEGRIPGLERLYMRSLVVEPTLACAAHCRFCLRANYPKHTMSEEELIEAARYCGNIKNRDELNEILITGGDPLIVPHRLSVLIEALMQYAPNIKIIRIATRLPQQAPNRVTNSVFRIFQKREGVRFELATQTNHPVELDSPVTCEIFDRFNDLGVLIYSQNVLLRGVNDDISTLIELYDRMRELNIGPHYLFHCIPLRGMSHLRTTVDEGIKLVQHLVTSGKISGRTKPLYAAMTDVGKIIFYENSILKRDAKNNKLLLQSYYRYEDRKIWNPAWTLPDSAEIDKNGYLRIWYLDGIPRT